MDVLERNSRMADGERGDPKANSKMNWKVRMKPVLTKAVDNLVCWMRESALPLWCEHGVNQASATCYETLLRSPPKSSVRVDNTLGWNGVSQAQGIYVLSQAQHLGWLADNKGDLITNMINFSGRHGVLPCRSDGFVRRIHSDFSIADGERFLFDHAFFMMASTAAFVAYDVGNDLRRAYNIQYWLDIKMSHPNVGWRQSHESTKSATSSSYLQLFQAFLYLFEVTKKPCWMERSGVVYDLFVEQFFDPVKHTVCKSMQDLDDSEVEGSRERVGASQMLCWVWVLRRYQRLMKGTPGDLLSDIANQLYSKALVMGDYTKTSSGLASYVLASLYQAQVGFDGAEENAVSGIDELFHSFISGSLDGWCSDNIEGKGQPSEAGFEMDSLFYLFEATREAYLYVNPLAREVPLREVGGL